MKVWMVFETVEDFCNTREHLVDVYDNEESAMWAEVSLNEDNNDPQVEYIVKEWEVKE